MRAEPMHKWRNSGHEETVWASELRDGLGNKAEVIAQFANKRGLLISIQRIICCLPGWHP